MLLRDRGTCVKNMPKDHYIKVAQPGAEPTPCDCKSNTWNTALPRHTSVPCYLLTSLNSAHVFNLTNNTNTHTACTKTFYGNGHRQTETESYPVWEAGRPAGCWCMTAGIPRTTHVQLSELKMTQHLTKHIHIHNKTHTHNGSSTCTTGSLPSTVLKESLSGQLALVFYRPNALHVTQLTVSNHW